MYDRKTVRRRRAVLALLVACSLILITASFGDGLRSIERGALEVFGPIEDGASRVLQPFRDAFGWVGETIEAKGKLDDLREERDQLRRQLVAERGALAENKELRAIVNLDQKLTLEQQGAVTARVTSRSPNLWYSTIKIDKGSRDGVREGNPVVNGQGLVGRVRRISGGNAQVLLLTDGDFGVAARVTEVRATGIVQPAVGDPDDLRLEHLRGSGRVRENHTVVTSGTEASRFPPDLPIGRVTRVDEDENTIHIKPFADLRTLEFVQVLTEPAL